MWQVHRYSGRTKDRTWKMAHGFKCDVCQSYTHKKWGNTTILKSQKSSHVHMYIYMCVQHGFDWVWLTATKVSCRCLRIFISSKFTWKPWRRRLNKRKQVNDVVWFWMAWYVVDTVHPFKCLALNFHPSFIGILVFFKENKKTIQSHKKGKCSMGRVAEFDKLNILKQKMYLHFNEQKKMVCSLYSITQQTHSIFHSNSTFELFWCVAPFAVSICISESRYYLNATNICWERCHSNRSKTK